MKQKMTRLVTLIICAAFSTGVRGADFSMSWHTIDGGGALHTTGGDFELDGTIGQADASSYDQALIGGDFELTGGFWVGAAPSTSLECSNPCGDFDNDGSIDLNDLLILVQCFDGDPASSQGCSCSDMNGDQVVDLNDLLIFVQIFETTPAGSPPNC